MRKLVLSLFAVLFCAIQLSAQRQQITGTVIGDDGAPIAGVAVVVEGSATGVSTQANGSYAISAPADGALVFSFLGYETLREEIGGRTVVNVTLSHSSMDIEGVMVIAYGTTTREAFTGSAGILGDAEIAKRQVSNITKALSGTVAGVQAYSSNGQPGTSATIRIRGVGSLSSDSKPLIVVDGIAYEGEMSNINPMDIETMSILKDASASAIYGARGANGVVMITTKKGSSQDARITFEARWGTNNRATKQYDVMTDPAMYLETVYKAAYNQQLNAGASDPHATANAMLVNSASNSGVIGYPVYTYTGDLIGTDGKLNPSAVLGYVYGDYYITPDNWYKESFKNPGLRQEYNVSVSGGNERSNYYFSSGYLNDEGYVVNSGIERVTTRMRADFQPKKWLRMNVNLTYTGSDQSYPGSQTTNYSTSSGNLFYVANIIAPVYPMYVRSAETFDVMKDDNGLTMYDFGDGAITGLQRTFLSMANPLAVLDLNYEKYKFDVFGGRWGATADIWDGLKATVNIGFDVENYTYTYRYNPYYGAYADQGGYIYKYRYKDKSYNQQYLLTYSKRIDQHNFDILAGYESYERRYSMLGGQRYGLYRPDGNELNNASTDTQYAYSSASIKYANIGILTRAQYDYAGKYFVSGSFRRDASSRFHSDNRWGNFGSIGAAWIISHEDFYNVNLINFLKVKASWGAQGNDMLLDSDGYANYYPYLNQYTLTVSDGSFATTLNYKGNKDITWETSYNTNIGVEFGMFNNRLTGELTYFNRKTKDLLYNKPVALSSGYSTIPVNMGDMRNRGFEFDLHGVILQSNNFIWTMNVNGTYLKNEILSLPEKEIIDGNRIYRVGGSYYNYYLREYAGVNTPDIDITGNSDDIGKALYYYTNASGERDVTIDWTQADQVDQGSALPKFYGGFGMSFDFYGFDVFFSLAYQLGGKVYDNTYASLMTPTADGRNYHKDILNAWTPDNNSNIPRILYGDTDATRVSTRFLTKSDYLSLNNVTVGYSLPSNLTNKIGINGIRVFFSGENLCYLSARKGLDPRQVLVGGTGNYSYQSIRSLVGGITLTF